MLYAGLLLDSIPFDRPDHDIDDEDDADDIEDHVLQRVPDSKHDIMEIAGRRHHAAIDQLLDEVRVPYRLIREHPESQEERQQAKQYLSTDQAECPSALDQHRDILDDGKGEESQDDRYEGTKYRFIEYRDDRRLLTLKPPYPDMFDRQQDDPSGDV